MNRIVLILVVLLAVAGVADSGYALKQHYDISDVSSCDINETISCTAVNQSEYSEVAGVPVAAGGIAGYLTMGVLAGLALFEWPVRRLATGGLSVLSSVALAGSLYLTYIEVFVLKAVCPLCVISLTLVTVITVLSVLAVVRLRRRPT